MSSFSQIWKNFCYFPKKRLQFKDILQNLYISGEGNSGNLKCVTDDEERKWTTLRILNIDIP